MSCNSRRRYAGILALAILAMAQIGVTLAQSQAAATGTATSTKPASAPAKKPTLDQLSAGKTAPLDFENASVETILAFVGRAYGVEIENNYKIVDMTAATREDPTPKPLLITMKTDALPIRDAIGILNVSILPLGYAIVESVRLREDVAHTPYGVLTVVATRKDAGASRPVYYGMDAEKIPEGDDQRTQVITLKYLELEKATEIVTSVLAKKADITVNPARNTLIITDTATHVHAAAAILQVMEKQLAPKEQ